jgi:hypothetical protein
MCIIVSFSLENWTLKRKKMTHPFLFLLKILNFLTLISVSQALTFGQLEKIKLTFENAKKVLKYFKWNSTLLQSTMSLKRVTLKR